MSKAQGELKVFTAYAANHFLCVDLYLCLYYGQSVKDTCSAKTASELVALQKKSRETEQWITTFVNASVEGKADILRALSVTPPSALKADNTLIEHKLSPVCTFLESI